jgi:hypothetical protein
VNQDTNIQLVHARTLIDVLHPSPAVASMVEITGLAPKTIPIKRYFMDGRTAADFAIDTNLRQYSVFVSINPRSAMSGFERDVPAVTALGLDIDVRPGRIGAAEAHNRLVMGGIPPTVTAVSGNGNHFYVRLAEPADPLVAKPVWERLCKFTGSDAVFNTNRIFRLAGSVNWKNPARWCYLTGVYRERVYTIQQVAAALDRLGAPPAQRRHAEGIPVSVDPPEDWMEMRRRLHAGVLDIIDTGEKNAFSEKQITRSEADWVVVCALIQAGASDDMIHWVFERCPVGLLKYHEAGARYLNQTIESARRATAEPILDRPVVRSASIPKYTGGAGDYGRRRFARNLYR